jgi:hypothetical protein
MVGILLQMFSSTPSAIRFLDAVEAIETSPMTCAAWRYLVMTMFFLMTGAALLLAAALMDSLAEAHRASEILGYSGLGCLQAFGFCGIRYKAVNRVAPDQIDPATQK